MTYQYRIMKYEEEKKKLQEKNLTYEEYMREIIKLAKKWKV